MIEPSDAERAELPPATANYVDALEDRISALEEALHRVRNWCDAYPIDVFTQPTESEIAASVEAMNSPGCASSERMHGSWARHILGGVREFTGVIEEE